LKYEVSVESCSYCKKEKYQVSKVSRISIKMSSITLQKGKTLKSENQTCTSNEEKIQKIEGERERERDRSLEMNLQASGGRDHNLKERDLILLKLARRNRVVAARRRVQLRSKSKSVFTLSSVSRLQVHEFSS
jgi:hypothetical protein